MPFYFLSERKRPNLVITVIHNYIYRHWLRPYRNDLIYKCFLAKLIRRSETLNCSAPLSKAIVNTLCSLNNSIYE